MLSPFFPGWLLPTLSPVFNFVARYVPTAWKGAVLLAVCLGVTAGVVLATPLDWPDWAAQGVILFGLAVGGYTLAKPFEAAGPRGLAAAGALIVGLFGVSAYAQDAASPPVQATAGFWAQVALSFLNGLLGRLVKRIPF